MYISRAVSYFFENNLIFQLVLGNLAVMYHTYFLTVVSCFQWQNENKSKFQLTQSPEWKLDMSTAFKKLKNKILVHRKTILWVMK